MMFEIIGVILLSGFALFVFLSVPFLVVRFFERHDR